MAPVSIKHHFVLLLGIYLFFFGHVPQHVRSLSPALEVQNLNQWAIREVPQKHFVMRLSLFGSQNVPITNL